MTVTRLLFLFFLVNGNSLNINNMRSGKEPQNNSTLCTEPEIWGTLVEDWALNLKKNRSDRVLKMPTEDSFILIHGTETDSSTGREKITSTSQANTPMYQITDTDLYLLGAIEKLAHRTQILEKRIKTLEEMFHYSLIGKEIIREPCPKKYIRIGIQCYFFSVKETEVKNWKNSNKFCKEHTAILLEMETVEENQDVINYIQSHANLKGKDFWTGGLNPGLLWIWSNSARPVFTSKNYLSESQENGRCLRLTYNTKYGTYMYGASDCSSKFNYICKIPDKTTSNKLNMFAKEHNVLK